MSTSNNSVPPPSGVVCNSVLSFVASAQPVQTPNESGNLQEAESQQAQAVRLIPPGLKALYEACHKLYPDQPNPLQVTTRLKYWLGGEDPLDYISMYWNPGSEEEGIPPHWHYVSFGLSDLHGDGRVHPLGTAGYGFELSMRVGVTGAQGPGAGAGPGAPARPPLWPTALCQALARYVFTTGNKLCAGDHVTWHRALDASCAALRHLLVATDAAFPPVATPHGDVHILQIVGCTGKELRAAQRGSGLDVLRRLAADPGCGGPLLVTVPGRSRSVRAPPSASLAPLAGVSASVTWTGTAQSSTEQSSPSSITSKMEQQIIETLQRGLTHMSDDQPAAALVNNQMSTDSFEMSSMERALPDIADTIQKSYSEDDCVRYYDSVQVIMNAEAGSLLPLAFDGRVSRGAHFTWRGADSAVTVLSPLVGHSLPTPNNPYAARGSWLQILITDSELASLSRAVSHLSNLNDSDSDGESDSPPPRLPLTVTSRGLSITILPDTAVL